MPVAADMLTRSQGTSLSCMVLLFHADSSGLRINRQKQNPLYVRAGFVFKAILSLCCEIFLLEPVKECLAVRSGLAGYDIVSAGK